MRKWRLAAASRFCVSELMGPLILLHGETTTVSTVSLMSYLRLTPPHKTDLLNEESGRRWMMYVLSCEIQVLATRTGLRQLPTPSIHVILSLLRNNLLKFPSKLFLGKDKRLLIFELLAPNAG